MFVLTMSRLITTDLSITKLKRQAITVFVMYGGAEVEKYEYVSYWPKAT